MDLQKKAGGVRSGSNSAWGSSVVREIDIIATFQWVGKINGATGSAAGLLGLWKISKLTLQITIYSSVGKRVLYPWKFDGWMWSILPHPYWSTRYSKKKLP